METGMGRGEGVTIERVEGGGDKEVKRREIR